MVKPLIHGGDWLDPDGLMDFPEDVDIIMAVDVEPTRKELRSGTHWVYCNFFEPRGTRTSNRYCLQYQNKFELILTLDPEILDATPKAHFFPFGMTWIRPEDQEREKEFSVSMICGGKDWMPGHKIRREVWARQGEIKTPKRFWRSSQGTPPGFADNPQLESALHRKCVAFDSMFHLCIENATDKNYFSEKLLDCFVTKTIPIYWGCSNIREYFTTMGIIQVQTAQDLIDAANNVTETMYHRMAPAIRDNAILATPYTRPMWQRVQEAITAKLFKANA